MTGVLYADFSAPCAKDTLSGEGANTMKKLSILTALVALVSFLLVGVPSGAVWADGTETLGPPSIAIASGTGVIVAGTGLSLAQPDTISINVPAGSTVEQVLLYWEGRDFSNGDDTIVINGTTTVIGSLIGGPLLWATPSGGGSFGSSYTYRADITNLGLVGDGPSANIISVGGLGFNVVNNGAGVTVIVDDGSSGSLIGIRDGNDLANDGFFKLLGPLTIETIAQTFTFSASSAGRTATLSMFVSAVSGTNSGGAFHPTAINVTVGGVTVTHNNILDSFNGEEWDTVVLPATVPAGEVMVTVQIFSVDNLETGDDPASLTWNMVALSVPAPVVVVSGDLDGDSDVDQDDLGIVVNCFGQFVADNPDCAIADVAPPPNGDGVINILDISFVGSNFTP